MTLNDPSAVDGSDWVVDEDERDGSDERDERGDDACGVARQSRGALGQRPLPEEGDPTRTGDRCAPSVVVMRADASCRRLFVSVRLSVVPPKAIGSTVIARNWQQASVTSRQSRSVRFRSEISCRAVPRKAGRLRRTQSFGVHAEAPRRTGAGQSRLNTSCVRRSNASMPLRVLCPSAFAEGGRGDVGRLGGGSVSGHSRWPGGRAGRWDNAPYRRWRTRRAPGTGAPPAWSPRCPPTWSPPAWSPLA